MRRKRCGLLLRDHFPLAVLDFEDREQPVREIAFAIERDVGGDARYLIFASAGMYFAGSVELAAFIAAAISITPS